MQYRKQELQEKILDKAKMEFLKQGFQGSSLRKIASNAGMTTGGIYTYFESKEDLFYTIVRPVVNKWEKKSEFFLAFTGIGMNNLHSDFEQKERLNNNYHYLINFVNLYREEMQLLFFKSKGTRYENFTEQLAADALKTARNILSRFPSITNQAYDQISDFFIKNIISFNINLIREMLLHNISLEEMLNYEKEITRFFYSGWEAVLSRSL